MKKSRLTKHTRQGAPAAEPSLLHLFLGGPSGEHPLKSPFLCEESAPKTNGAKTLLLQPHPDVTSGTCPVHPVGGANCGLSDASAPSADFVGPVSYGQYFKPKEEYIVTCGDYIQFKFQCLFLERTLAGWLNASSTHTPQARFCFGD